jgi:cytochrome c oxidase assembly factor CtaG
MHAIPVMLARVLIPPAAWSSWTFQPGTTIAVTVAGMLYGIGYYGGGARAIRPLRAWLFVLGIAVMLLATVSPLHAAAESTFSGHMIQHLVFMFVAAPLIVAGRPGLVMALAFPIAARKRMWSIGRAQPIATATRVAGRPLVILFGYAAVLWMWHLPGPYQAAIRSPGLHALEHAMFLGVSIAFWHAVVRTGPRRSVGHIPAMFLVLGTMLQSTLLAAILTFGGIAYPIYVARAAAWGIDPRADEQLAGTIMWVPSTILYLVVFGVLFVRWLKEMDSLHARRPDAVTLA